MIPILIWFQLMSLHSCDRPRRPLPPAALVPVAVSINRKEKKKTKSEISCCAERKGNEICLA
jgi:hypothetical protein